MVRTKTLICFLVLLLEALNTNKRFEPTELMNVSVFIPNEPKNPAQSDLHVFFLSAKLSLTDHSLQYFFFDELIFTHTEITLDENLTMANITYSKLLEILNGIVNDNGKMNNIQAIAQAGVKPVIYKFQKDGDVEIDNSGILTRNLERKILYDFVIDEENEPGIFTIYGNHFLNKGGILESKNDVTATTSSKTKNQYKTIVLLERYIHTETVDGIEIDTLRPCRLTLRKTLDKPYLTMVSFNFAKYKDKWHVTESEDTVNVSSTPVEETPNKDEINGIFGQLDKIFDLNAEYTPTNDKYSSNFIQRDFYSSLIHTILPPNMIETFINTLKQADNAMEQSLQLVKDGEYKDKNYTNYKILLMVKESFNTNVFTTKVDPFSNEMEELMEDPIENKGQTNKDDEPDTKVKPYTKPQKKTPHTNNKTSNTEIVIIVSVLLLVLILGLFGGRYYYSNVVLPKQKNINRKVTIFNKLQSI